MLIKYLRVMLMVQAAQVLIACDHQSQTTQISQNGGTTIPTTKQDENIVETITSPAIMPVAAPFNKVKEGMTYREVIQLLGPPVREGGSGALNITYLISPTESFVIRTSGNADNSIVMKYFYTKYRVPVPVIPSKETAPKADGTNQ